MSKRKGATAEKPKKTPTATIYFDQKNPLEQKLKRAYDEGRAIQVSETEFFRGSDLLKALARRGMAEIEKNFPGQFEQEEREAALAVAPAAPPVKAEEPMKTKVNKHFEKMGGVHT